MACIYLATNTRNGKRYVGFAQNLKSRRNIHHCDALTRNSPLLFHKALRKYGKDAFAWQILCESNNETFLLKTAESRYIKKLNTYYLTGHGYNMTHGGDGITGFKFTKKQKSRLSHIHKGKKHTDKTRERMSAAHTGRSNSPTHNAAIAAAFSKCWIVIAPNGRTTIVTNLKNYCRKKTLRYSAMHRIAQGKMRRHRGYRVVPLSRDTPF